jgi:hypothetical protein|nr:MAG TPA: hypothetical protein [Caudoviricetes sp.]
MGKLRELLTELISTQEDKIEKIDKDDFEEVYLEELNKLGNLREAERELDCIEDILRLYDGDV